MALKKQITFEDNIVTEYHFISYYGIDRLNGIISLYIRSYASATTRNEEKEYQEGLNTQDSIVSQINEEIIKETPDNELIDSLNEQLTTFGENPNTCLYTSFQNIQVGHFIDKEYSLSDLYTLLKETDTFKDSEDLL